MRRALVIFFLLIATGIGLKGQVKHVFPSDSFGLKTDTTFRIQSIQIIGNKLTKEKIILREITFSEGQVYSRFDLDEVLQDSYENLKNTSLFNFIKIECHYLIDHSVVVIFQVEERWYIWPFPVFDYTARNFSEFIKNKKWDRLNYGMYLRIENFRGRNEIIKIKAIAGYRKQLELFYYTPNLDKKQRFGLESYLTYFMWDDVEYNTFGNQMLSFKDTVNFQILRNETESTTSLFYRKNYRDRHRLAFTYLNGNILDTIASLNPDYFGKSNTRFDYFRLIYHYYNDHRDYKYYPLNGYYWDAFAVNEYEKNSDFYNFYVQGSVRYYRSISDRFYISSGVKLLVFT